jgi:DNA polymerase/3'-5' exonuclease PolX
MLAQIRNRLFRRTPEARLYTIEDARALADINTILRGERYVEMHALARRITEQLKPHVEASAILGSIRRKHHSPNDIDIMIRRPTDQAWRLLREIGGIPQLQGDRKQYTVYGVTVDIIHTNPEDWGLGLVQFTGSKGFDEVLFQRARAQNLEVQNGRIGTTNSYDRTFIPAMKYKTETEILNTLGLGDFVDPTLRDWPRA